MAFDYEGAIAAGYSPNEIADYLGKQKKFDVAGARKAGYDDYEIITHLSTPVAAAPKVQQKEGLFPSLKEGAISATESTIRGAKAPFTSEEQLRQEYEQQKAAAGERNVAYTPFSAIPEAYEKEGLGAAVGTTYKAARDALGRSLPSMAPVIAGSATGARIGAFGGPLAEFTVPLGAVIGGIAGATPMFAGTNIERRIEEKTPGPLVTPEVYTTGAQQAALDTAATMFTLGTGLVAKVVGRPITQVSEQSLLRTAENSLTKTVGKGAARGAVSEMPTEVAQQVLERKQAGLSLTSEDAYREYGEVAAAAGVLGAGFGGVGNIVTRSQARDFRDEQDAKIYAEQARIREANQEAARVRQAAVAKGLAQEQAAELARQAYESKLREPLKEQLELDLAPETTVEEVAAQRAAVSPQGDLFLPQAPVTETATIEEAPSLNEDTIKSFGFKKNSLAYKAMEALNNPEITPAEQAKRFDQIIENNQDKIKSTEQEEAINKFKTFMDQRLEKERVDELGTVDNQAVGTSADLFGGPVAGEPTGGIGEPVGAGVAGVGTDVGTTEVGADEGATALAQEPESTEVIAEPIVQRPTPEERQQRIIQQRLEEEAARKAEKEANLAETKAFEAGRRTEELAPVSEMPEAEREGLEAAKDVDMSQRMEQGVGTTPAQIQDALQDWYIDPTAAKQAAKIVNTVNELPLNVARLIGSKAAERGIDRGAIQAFTHEGTAYLIADRIKPGTERSVFMHEVGAHLGLKQAEVNSLANKINKWANAAEGTIEREVYNAVQQRMESAKELSNEELVAYTVEEAANRGVTPQAVLRAKAAPPNTVAGIVRYLAEKFMSASKAAFNAFTSNPTPQDLIDYVYGSTRKVLQEGAVEKEPETAGWSDKRISDLMDKYAYGNDADRTKAYAVKMSPQKFLDITTEKGYQRELKKETTPLNKEQLAKETQDIFLYVDPTDNPNVFEVSGHEGRHRMIALARAGVTEVPVVLNLRGGQKVQPVDVAYLTAQRGDGVLGEGQQGEWVADLTPISYAYKKQLTDKFGKGSIRFSAKSTEPTGDNIFRDLVTPRVADARLNLGAAVRKITPKLLSMYQLVDQFGAEMPALQQYSELNDKMTMTQQRLKNKAQSLLSEWGNFSFKNPVMHKKLGKLMLDATRSRIHPDEEIGSEANAHLTQEDAAKHEELSNAYNALSPEAKQIYQRARALLQENFDLRRTIYNDMVRGAYAEDLAEATPEEAEKINARIDKAIGEHELLLNEMRGPYFPLMRFGEYLVVAESNELRELREDLARSEGTERKRLIEMLRQMEQSDEHYQVHAFEKRSEQAREAQRLKNSGMNIRETKSEDYMSNIRANSFGAIDQLEKIFDREIDLDVDPAQMRQLRQAMIDSVLAGLPENSALQRQIKRRNIAGATENMLQAFAETMERDSHYLSRMGYMKPLSKSLIDMRDQSKNDMQLRDVYNNVRARMNLDMRYDNHPILSKLTGISSIYHLGIAPSYLLQNMTQPFAITLPQLAGRYGAGKTSKALISAWKDASKAVKGGRNGKFFSLKDTDLSNAFSGGELKMVEMLQDLGKLDIANNMDTEVYTKGMSPKMIKFWNMFNWSSHNIELMNRLSSALAAYRLEKGKGASDEGAAKAARDAVELTQLDYSDTNAAYFMKQGHMGGMNRIPMQFRKYQQGMIYLLARNFKNAWGGDKEAKKAFFYLMGTQLLMAGVRGVPVAAPLLFLMGAFGDDDDKDGDLETQLRNALADSVGPETARVFWKGLPAMLGLDSGSMSMENLFLPFPMMRSSAITDAATGKDAVTELMYNLGGAPVSMLSRFGDAFILGSEGDYQKALEKVLPKFMSSLVKAERLGDEGITTRSGNVAIEGEEFSAWDQAIKAMGFTPTKESEYYQAMYAKERISQAIDDRRNRIIKAMAKARLNGEVDQEALEQAKEFNSEHPSRRITGESITRSVAQRRKDKQQRAESGVRYEKRERDIRDVTRYAN